MKITIITVCYNSAGTIGSTLRSIARQTFRDFEHIIVDGGSTDGTLALINHWDGHPVRLANGPDRGIYDAMNKGIAMATGDVLGFLNADDRYANDGVLHTIAAAFADGRTDFSHGDLVFVNAGDRKVTRYWKGSPFDRREFLRGWLPPHPTLYIRRSLVEAVGPFSLSYRVAADIEWMMRFLSRGNLHSIYIPKILVEMDAGGASNAGWRAFLSANRDVWKACRALKVSPAPFVFGKTARKLPQWWRQLRAH